MTDEMNNAVERDCAVAAAGSTNTAALQSAKKDVAEKAKALVQSAQDLQQMALLDTAPFEADVALPLAEIRKRYTGTNGKHIAERREQVVKMLAHHINVSVICDVLRMSHHTVEAIAAQETQGIAAFSETQAMALSSDAMADIAVARTKRDQASYKDLHIAAGIKLTHAANLKLAGAALGDLNEVMEVEEENPKLVAARKFLEARSKPQMDTDETQIKEHNS